MNKKILSLLGIIFIFFFINKLYASEKFAFIDLNYIYSNSKVGKKIINETQKKQKIINKEFKDFQKKLDEEKNNLISQKKNFQILKQTSKIIIKFYQKKIKI